MGVVLILPELVHRDGAGHRNHCIGDYPDYREHILFVNRTRRQSRGERNSKVAQLGLMGVGLLPFCTDQLSAERFGI